MERGRFVNKSIALFGGTFNPPHIGHYIIAKEVIKQYNIKTVYFIPSFLPPHKDPKNIIDAKHRENMVKLLINNEKDLKFSKYELNKKKVSYTIDTVEYFKNKFPSYKIYFIAGSDAFYFIDTWRESEKLFKLLEFIVYIRRDYPKEKILKKYKNVKINFAGHGLINIASTSIRNKIKKGINCESEVGSKIWNYIIENNLYR
jgi:nicotinate-nucleotide adenylyltransferase